MAKTTRTEEDEDNLVLKSRCKDFLRPKDKRSGRHTDWKLWFGIPLSGLAVYSSKFNVRAPDDGEDYYVKAWLIRQVYDGKTRVTLIFQDMVTTVLDEGYKPLRRLGDLVSSTLAR